MAPKRPGLGKGLDALIPSHPEGEILSEFGGVLEVPLELISTNPHQPRKGFDDEKPHRTTLRRHFNHTTV
jgi:hypothetical protein